MATATFCKQSDSTDLSPPTSIHAGDGVIRRRLFFREQSRLPVRFDVWELAPGASEGNHIHGAGGNRPLEEIYYFLEGHGVLLIEGEEVPVAPGDAVLVPPGVDHGLYNRGTEPLRLVLLFGEPHAIE